MAWLTSAREKNLAFAQGGDDPALDYLNPHLRLGLVSGSVRPRRNDRHAVVLPQVPIGRVQIRLVIAGMRDGALQVIRHHDFAHAAEKLEGALMRTNPVPQILPGRGFREGIAAGAQHGHEDGGGLHVTALRIVNRNRGAGIVDEHLLAGAVLLS